MDAQEETVNETAPPSGIVFEVIFFNIQSNKKNSKAPKEMTVRASPTLTAQSGTTTPLFSQNQGTRPMQARETGRQMARTVSFRSIKGTPLRLYAEGIPYEGVASAQSHRIIHRSLR